LIRRVAEFQFLRFSAVGIVNTAIHYGVFLVLLRLFHANYLVASIVGYGCGLMNGYVLNRRWTFQSSDPDSSGEFVRFFIVNLVALSANSAVLYAGVQDFGWRPEQAQLVALAFSLTMNFFGNKLWTFKRRTVAL
jgi:putative flippase GtrA